MIDKIIDRFIIIELAIIAGTILYLLVEFTLYHWSILFTALVQ